MNVKENVILLELYFVFLLLLLPLYDCQRPTFIMKPQTPAKLPDSYWRITNEDGITGPVWDYTPNGTTIHPFLRSTTTVVWHRSLPDFISTHDYCDYVAVLCLEVHQTGRICGRTLYHIYNTFINYCNLEYVNCMEGWEVWQMSHPGDCYYLKDIGRDYMRYDYMDDFQLDQYYVQNDW